MQDIIKKHTVVTTTNKTIHLNVDECQVKPQFTDKSKFLGRTILPRKDIFIAKERDIISKENFEKIYSMSEEILTMISALIKRLENE